MYSITNMKAINTKKDVVAKMRKQLFELEEYLGYGYVKQVKEKLGYEVADGTITAVKTGHRNTVGILTAILTVAKENRDAAQKSIES